MQLLEINLRYQIESLNCCLSVILHDLLVCYLVQIIPEKGSELGPECFILVLHTFTT